MNPTRKFEWELQSAEWRRTETFKSLRSEMQYCIEHLQRAIAMLDERRDPWAPLTSAGAKPLGGYWVGVNPLGEIQSRGSTIDRLCGQLDEATKLVDTLRRIQPPQERSMDGDDSEYTTA